MAKINTVWIVDDDDIYTYVLMKNIKILNICEQIIIHANGAKGIQALKESLSSNENLPDLIFLDINMPIMDGWQFLDEFVKHKHVLAKPIDIYLASSSIALEDKSRAKSYPEISAFLEKPISTEKLTQITGLQ